MARSPWTFLGLLVVLWVPLSIAGNAPLGLPVDLPLAGLVTFLPLMVASALVARERGPRALPGFWRSLVAPRALFRRPVPLVATLGTVPLCLAVSAGVVLTVGPAPDRSAPAIPVWAVPALTVAFGIAAVAEEAGWTGYLLEPLRRRYGTVGAALLIGGTGAALHLYGWAVLLGRSFAWTAGMAVATVVLRVLAVWVHDRSGGSVLSAVLLHTTVNVCSLLFPQYYSPPVVAGCATVLVTTAALVHRALARRAQARSRTSPAPR